MDYSCSFGPAWKEAKVACTAPGGSTGELSLRDRLQSQL